MAPQPGEGAEPAGSQAQIFPRPPRACRETRVSGTSPGEASAGRRVEREPHPGTARDCRQRRPRRAAARERGREVSAEERLSTGRTATSAQTPPGGRQRQWARAAQALQARVLQNQQYQTPHLPGHPWQLVQPCGTTIPILQAHSDVPMVLVLLEPDVSALPVPGGPPWPELPLCSASPAAGGRQRGAASSGFGGPHSLRESLSRALFPRGVSLSARQRRCQRYKSSTVKPSTEEGPTRALLGRRGCHRVSHAPPASKHLCICTCRATLFCLILEAIKEGCIKSNFRTRRSSFDIRSECQVLQNP